MADVPLTLAGRYRLDQIIGRGGMAEVWRGRDLLLGRDVAIKRLRADLATDPTFQARFQREAHSAAGLNHPNIVAVYDTGSQIDGASGVAVPYIVMELVHGRTLRDLLADGSTITPAQALTYTEGVLDALAYSHQRGIVHRDIKPANVMLTPAGSIKVMDFGIARAVSDTSATMTQTAAVIGTAQYLSPEQARGETVDARSDVYSTGCLLYELLTHRPPFIGDSPVSVAYQHVREMPIPPSQLNSAITPAIDAIVMQSLAKNPGDRYQSAQDMHDDIARGLAGQQVQAAVPTVAVGTVLARPEPTRVMGPSPVVVAPPPPPPGTPVAAAAPAPSAPTAPLTRQTGPIPLTEDPDYDDEDDDGDRRRGISVAAIVLIVLALLAVGAIAVVLIKLNASGGGGGGTPTPTQVQVPLVMDLAEADAKVKITNASLFPSVVGVNPNGNVKECTLDKVDKVVKQDPSAQSLVTINSTVTITVCQPPDTITIPTDLRGKSQIEAQTEIKALGYTGGWGDPIPATADKEPPTLKAGEVVDTQPAMGSKVSVNGPITLVVATGKSLVPSVQGQTESAAIQILTDAGFTNVKSAPAPAGVPPETVYGTVVDQSPKAGEAALRSAEVTISVSSNITLPDLKGLTPDAAKAKLGALGWSGPPNVVTMSAYEDEMNVPKGQIVRTSPEPGSGIAPTDPVTFYVASGQSVVPDVVGKSKDTATTFLTNAGFVADPQDGDYSDTIAAGSVLEQNPPVDTVLDRGSTVTIYISKGREPAPPSPTRTPPSPTESPAKQP